MCADFGYYPRALLALRRIEQTMLSKKHGKLVGVTSMRAYFEVVNVQNHSQVLVVRYYVSQYHLSLKCAFLGSFVVPHVSIGMCFRHECTSDLFVR